MRLPDDGDGERLLFFPPLIGDAERFPLRFLASSMADDVTRCAIANERLTAASLRTCWASDIYLFCNKNRNTHLK